MFKFFCYLSISGKIKDNPKGYYSINADPSYRMGYAETIICRQQNPSFDEILRCLRKCFTKADYLGCYSMIYWKHYEAFYLWIKESVASQNSENIKVIKKFHKKALNRWLAFIEHSDDTGYPQNAYFRKMYAEIQKLDP